MPRFLIEINNGKKRTRIIFGYLVIIIGIALLLFSLLSHSGQLNNFLNSIIALNCIWTGINLMKGPKGLFVDIDEQRIEWLVREKTERVTQVEWTDIRWIKKEQDNSITLYRESSFSNNFSLEAFNEEVRTSILELVKQQAIAWQIRLISF